MPATPGSSPALRVDVAARSHRGRVREVNEDAFVVFRTGRILERVESSISEEEMPTVLDRAGHLMIVADGLGGHEAGEVASRSALVTTLKLVIASPRWALSFDDARTRQAKIRDLQQRARNYLSRVHEAVRDQAATNPALSGMGTTLTGAYAIGSDLFVLHIGDSKAYLDREGALRKLTHDHTVAQEYADRGVISQDDVSEHHLQHVLTRAIGGSEETAAGDFHHFAIRDGDRLLLCSDGLTDMANEAAIAGVLRSYASSAAAADALIDLALEAGGRDNVTVIVAGFSAG
jgi:protein phosphatase